MPDLTVAQAAISGNDKKQNTWKKLKKRTYCTISTSTAFVCGMTLTYLLLVWSCYI